MPSLLDRILCVFLFLMMLIMQIPTSRLSVLLTSIQLPKWFFKYTKMIMSILCLSAFSYSLSPTKEESRFLLITQKVSIASPSLPLLDLMLDPMLRLQRGIKSESYNFEVKTDCELVLLLSICNGLVRA